MGDMFTPGVNNFQLKDFLGFPKTPGDCKLDRDTRNDSIDVILVSLLLTLSRLTSRLLCCF